MESRDSGSELGDFTYEKCKAQLKLTQSGPFYTPKLEDLDVDEDVDEDVDVGTQTVIMEGREIDLSDSGELTPEKIKEALARTRQTAQNHAKRTREISTELANTPTKPFRTMKFKQQQEPERG